MKATEQPKWTEHRHKQLEDLRHLLRECEMIDKANNVVSRLQYIIASAKALNNSSRERRESSFVNFLEDIAIASDSADA